MESLPIICKSTNLGEQTCEFFTILWQIVEGMFDSRGDYSI